MKKLTSILLLFIVEHSFCQRAPFSKPYTQEELIKVSKSQKKAGLIFLGIGVGVGAVGIYKWSKNWWTDIRPNLMIGGVTTLISIPFFIAAGKNAKKAKDVTVSFKLEENQFEQLSQSGCSSIPAISLKLNL